MASDCLLATDASILLHQSMIFLRSCGILVKYYKKPLYIHLSCFQTKIRPKRLFNAIIPSLTVIPNPFSYSVKHLRQFMWHARISFTTSILFVPISDGYQHASHKSRASESCLISCCKRRRNSSNFSCSLAFSPFFFKAKRRVRRWSSCGMASWCLHLLSEERKDDARYGYVFSHH